MNTSPKMIHEGGLLFNAECAGCHGVNAVAGPLPDLRYASKTVHEQFQEIVLGGARASLGMPSFKKIFTPEQVRAIEVYLVARQEPAVNRVSRFRETSNRAQPSGSGFEPGETYLGERPPQTYDSADSNGPFVYCGYSG